ncbi:dipeptidyl aminopeptidase/acylaminoacyl peptidase [Amycolatopsis sulphurea]|uniref:Dipeptidyl aminopeptidase/acylaminoacyl peptidase n=1 Tax=Amycolatopsis sulphurea TaxID=76022 RepID=A0A2A9G403_9PSEU|nr:DPP IV N-terminal domain-containing protein [Amycolatopsis sulphurea]PFG57550.1 dipeptidyl aminopeptidase/acylaminoacyl peptidase [Amycolatopsis sulphurea]
MPDLSGRYATAEAMLPHKLRKLISSSGVLPTWFEGTETFWYRNQVGTGHEFVVVDAEVGTRRPAFDHVRMATALATVLDTAPAADALPISDIEQRDGAVRVTAVTRQVEVDLDSYTATDLGEVRQGEALSPDGRWAVLTRDHNLVLRDTETGEERQLTTDGVDGNAYAGMTDQVAALVMQENLGLKLTPLVVWSPDSTRFVTHRLDQRGVELMHLVRSSPFDGGRPRVLSYRYALPGEEKVASAEFFVFDAATGKSVKADCGPVTMPFVPAIAYGWVWWSKDQTKAYWLSNDRGDHNVALHELDAATGAVKVLVRESSTSHILYGPQQQDCNIRTLSTGEVLWWSQRSGFGHLYRYDPDGTVTTLTSGEWMVRHVVTVDEDARRVVFTAGGHDKEADPYLQQLCAVSLDGGVVEAITSDGLDHVATPSKSGRYFVDIASRWDEPPVTVLRDRAGTVVTELERADASALYATGWTAPERAVVKAADGVTDVYCAVYRPFDFDPAKTYPVLDCIYPGPQISSAPMRFPTSPGPFTGSVAGFNHPEAFAALGFVVTVVDGRGGALRSQPFQDHSRVSGDAVFVDDHVAAIKQLGESRSWMDLDRVGIYGYSAGGFASARSILQAPDFYRVAVSSAGNHDNRINHAWWGEKFFGLTEDFDFARQANVSLAHQLKGKLLLIHGEMDDNATPHGTMRLVDALMKADKDFDLLIVPNADHHMMVHRAYFIRKRWDYFVRHLMGETPPVYQLDEVPIF